MKNVAKGLIGACAIMMVAGSASANLFDCMSPIIGVDYYQPWMKAKFGWNDVLPKDSYPGVTAYFGARFADCWGLEIGYDGSSKKSKNFVLSDAFFFADRSTVTGTSTIRRTGGHIDLIGYVPVDCCDCFEVFASLGYGYVRPKMTINIISFSGPRGNPYAFALNSVTAKGGSVVRLGVGANYMVTGCVGVRAKLGYENTSSLRFKGTAFATNTNGVVSGINKAFKDTASLSLGAFVKF